MRTAILYSGSAYNIKYSIQSQLENLIIPNNADVFIFTNRFCKRRTTPSGYIPDPNKMHLPEENEKWVEKCKLQTFEDSPLTDEEIQLMKDVLGDRLKVFQLAEETPGYMEYLQNGRYEMLYAINSRLADNRQKGLPTIFDGKDQEDPNSGNIRNTSDQYKHVKKCFELMMKYESENNIKYDWVMRARIDFIVPFKFNIAHYYLNHDAPYLYNCSGFRNDADVEWAEEHCWFSKRIVADKLFPELHRVGTIINHPNHKTINYRHPVIDMLFAPEVQYCLLLLELGLHVITVPIHRSATYTKGDDGLDYFNYMFRRDKISLEIEYKLVCDCATDINEHLPVLRKYAEQCDHVTELGVRYGNSTVAFMAARPKKFIAYDLQYNDKMDYLKLIAEESNLGFELKIENPLNLEDGRSELEETDLLFIDTNHHATQLREELRLHSPKAKKYIIMHDTTIFYDRGAGDDHMDDGMKLAIEPFLENSKEWVMRERFMNNNGLMVLERIN